MGVAQILVRQLDEVVKEAIRRHSRITEEEVSLSSVGGAVQRVVRLRHRCGPAGYPKRAQF